MWPILFGVISHGLYWGSGFITGGFAVRKLRREIIALRKTLVTLRADGWHDHERELREAREAREAAAKKEIREAVKGTSLARFVPPDAKAAELDPRAPDYWAKIEATLANNAKEAAARRTCGIHTCGDPKCLANGARQEVTPFGLRFVLPPQPRRFEDVYAAAVADDARRAKERR